MKRDGNDDTRRLWLLQGGLAERGDDARSRDWQRFCARIGWQEPTATALPASYEDDLVARIFGIRDGDATVVPIDGHPAHHERAEDDGHADDRFGLARLALVAIVALAVVGLTILSASRKPPTAAVPTPTREAEQPAPAPAPSTVEQRNVEAPPLEASVKPPDPGAAPARVAARQRHEPSRPRMREEPPAPQAVEPTLDEAYDAAITPDAQIVALDQTPAFGSAGRRPLLGTSWSEPSPAPAAAVSASAGDMPSLPAALPWPHAPEWMDVGMDARRVSSDSRYDVRFMAQVDLAAVGRRLLGRL
jgi:hypothetical protein